MFYYRKFWQSRVLLASLHYTCFPAGGAHTSHTPEDLFFTLSNGEFLISEPMVNHSYYVMLVPIDF